VGAAAEEREEEVCCYVRVYRTCYCRWRVGKSRDEEFVPRNPSVKEPVDYFTDVDAVRDRARFDYGWLVESKEEKRGRSWSRSRDPPNRKLSLPSNSESDSVVSQPKSPMSDITGSILHEDDVESETNFVRDDSFNAGCCL